MSNNKYADIINYINVVGQPTFSSVLCELIRLGYTRSGASHKINQLVEQERVVVLSDGTIKSK